MIILFIFLILALFLFAAAVSAIIALVIYAANNSEHKNFVQSNSVALKRLDELNQKYSFSCQVNLDLSHTYDNEKYYDTISCCDYLIYQLQFNQKEINNRIKNACTNQVFYKKYIEEINSFGSFGVFENEIGELNRDKLLEIEKQLFDSSIQHPQTKFSIKVTLFYRKMNGYIYKQKNQTFTTEEIGTLIKRVNNKNGTYFNDKEIWYAICKVERGKVSNKMRFSIYERDGNRCRKCGVSGRYAQLEIDHIIPISKGGKSTYNNLQTLCHSCNVNKSDSMPY